MAHKKSYAAKISANPIYEAIKTINRVMYIYESHKMKLSLLIVIFFLAVAASAFIYKIYRNKNFKSKGEAPIASSFDFYSINDGNQTQLIYAPNYNKEWFDELDKKYSWDKFGLYDNRYFEYMYNLFDTLPALAKGTYETDADFFSKLTRGQKVFYSTLVFGGEVDNGGVYQFFFNRPEFCFAALETFQELGPETLKQDYEKCLNEFIGMADSYAKRKTIANDPGINMEKRKKAFADGYKDIPSAKTIEDYFYNEEFKKMFYKRVVDYIDKNLNQFVRR